MSHSPSDTDHPDLTPDTDTATSEYPITVEDPSTGARIILLKHDVDEQGAYLIMDGVLPPRTDSGPARLHPRSEVRSEVMAGRANVTVQGTPTSCVPASR